MPRLHAPLRLAALAFFALALAGCGPGGAWGLAALVVLLLAIAGCSESREIGTPDATVEADARVVPRDASTPPDAPGDAGGSWETCCESGVVSTCFCPGGASCNYGLGLVVCDDGSCGYGDPAEICAPDAGTPDAGEPDAGGTWEPCCNAEGRIDTCFCPAGVACNYGLYEDCGDGLCVLPGEPCPSPA